MTGREAERFVAEFLSERGYFVGDFNKSSSGQQPFDQIAINYNSVLAYDVKHCKTDYFPFSRIEDNQIRALDYIWKLNNETVKTMILIVYEGAIYCLPFSQFKTLKVLEYKSIRPTELTPLETILEGE